MSASDPTTCMLWSTKTTVRPSASCLTSAMVRSTSSSPCPRSARRAAAAWGRGPWRWRARGPASGRRRGSRPAARRGRRDRPRSSSSMARSRKWPIRWTERQNGSRARSGWRGRARGARRSVIWSKRLVIWKDRAIPSWAICSGCLPVMSLPSNRIGPDVGGEEAGEQVEQRGLAGAVGADERVDGALGDGEVDVGDRPEAAELLGQGAGLQDAAEGASLGTPAPPRAVAEPAGTGSGSRED